MRVERRDEWTMKRSVAMQPGEVKWWSGREKKRRGVKEEEETKTGRRRRRLTLSGALESGSQESGLEPEIE